MDPRIYRACLALIVLAVIIFAFSLKNQPGPVPVGATSGPVTASPQASFSSTRAQMVALAGRYPDRRPGSAGDAALAAEVRASIARVGGFSIRSDRFTATTADGRRSLVNVIASRPGLVAGQVVVVAGRDSAGSGDPAGLAGTAVLLDLARVLAGETLQRTVTLVSTTATVGSAGASRLARTLSGEPVDAVIVLGDLAGSEVGQPAVVPFASVDTLAPPVLRSTLSRYLRADAAIATEPTGLAGQLARLAFPFALTAQAPLLAAGIPAATLSLSGDRVPGANLPAGSAERLSAVGAAVLHSVNALDHGRAVGSPRPYLLLSGKLVPAWAVRLLVLALLIPVLAATIDAVARARRRGHSILRWVGWVLAGVIPFLAGFAVLRIGAATGALRAPPGAVSGGVSLSFAAVGVIVAALAATVLAFVFVRPWCLEAAAGLSGPARRPQSPPADAAAVALSVVMSLLAVIVWTANPFAALLLVPALHLWLWLAVGELRAHRWALAPVVGVAVVPALAVCAYYCLAYGTSPLGLAWSIVLMAAGGAISVAAAVSWCVALGALSGAVVIALRSIGAATAVIEAPVTVRGPATYAGPGSLGGTESALRR